MKDEQESADRKGFFQAKIHKHLCHKVDTEQSDAIIVNYKPGEVDRGYILENSTSNLKELSS